MAEEIGNDTLFVSKHNENVWWFDGQRIIFRTPNYAKILNALRSMPSVTLNQMKEITGINTSAIQKLVGQLITKGYVHRIL